MYTTTVAGLDQQSDVCIHKRNCHRYCRAIWQNKIGVLTEFLDDAEDIIPSPAIQAGTMVSKFIDDLNSISLK